MTNSRRDPSEYVISNIKRRMALKRLMETGMSAVEAIDRALSTAKGPELIKLTNAFCDLSEEIRRSIIQERKLAVELARFAEERRRADPTGELERRRLQELERRQAADAPALAKPDSSKLN